MTTARGGATGSLRGGRGRAGSLRPSGASPGKLRRPVRTTGRKQERVPGPGGRPLPSPAALRAPLCRLPPLAQALGGRHAPAEEKANPTDLLASSVPRCALQRALGARRGGRCGLARGHRLWQPGAGEGTPWLRVSARGGARVYLSRWCLMYTHLLCLLPNKRNTSVLPTETARAPAPRSPRAQRRSRARRAAVGTRLPARPWPVGVWGSLRAAGSSAGCPRWLGRGEQGAACGRSSGSEQRLAPRPVLPVGFSRPPRETWQRCAWRADVADAKHTWGRAGAGGGLPGGLGCAAVRVLHVVRGWRDLAGQRCHLH